ncbi:MAG: hypothetical protein GY795_23250 [Desulfobacterales bacterium]|nr:hypothetical protein [Desulfobacterales bacterium]
MKIAYSDKNRFQEYFYEIYAEKTAIFYILSAMQKLCRELTYTYDSSYTIPFVRERILAVTSPMDVYPEEVWELLPSMRSRTPAKRIRASPNLTA